MSGYALVLNCESESTGGSGGFSRFNFFHLYANLCRKSCQIIGMTLSGKSWIRHWKVMFSVMSVILSTGTRRSPAWPLPRIHLTSPYRPHRLLLPPGQGTLLYRDPFGPSPTHLDMGPHYMGTMSVVPALPFLFVTFQLSWQVLIEKSLTPLLFVHQLAFSLRGFIWNP